eukprot:TRINITY_DN31174_c1_g1_i1.p1 TRINITY_DN31174_c1_g1~~TRINITY_DN31174_c1_g1_i1.p1  ORF type:complete len:310 (+),score=53.00 TRINITY_DN31174_c1_g1_i1:75-932(+)
MGNCMHKKTFKSEQNEPIESTDREVSLVCADVKVHVLICGLNYTCDQTWAGRAPLDTSFAFNMMQDLAVKAKADTINCLWNEQATAQGIIDGIHSVGGECDEGDYFVFYYTGHGDRLPDPELDGEFVDCLCTVGNDGNVEPRDQVWLKSPDLAEAIQEAVHPDAKILVLADCCHSGSILEVSNPKWVEMGYDAISIAGCEDVETSAGTGKGGEFSRALSRAVEQLSSEREEGYMVSEVYNCILEMYNKYHNPSHEQHITIHGCGVYPQEFPWPLHPKQPYTSIIQ